ncbi:hypothetical protein [Pseudomonas donghuensis]|uniref:Uncharacterized protein n=1 Tax=Pseudomonas donghuensis TaxID=1163398 RepID=A0AAP0XHM5_9PSED|nr:hypothetical protein [Pseudomonas donghuensis]KDO00911.2 hypothetical protein BV82_1365 [Pseudomonas donghuensis]MCP6694176.1 hypothetical protein [Pseudomonas donghuensis]MDF9892908.1 hypothetical protein [Pseudomonas vranovensis]
MNPSMTTAQAQQAEYPQPFAELTEHMLFGEMCTRTQWTPRERSLATAQE